MVAFLRFRQGHLRGGPRADSVIVYVDANGALVKVAADGTETVIAGATTPAAFVEPTTATPEAIAQAMIDAGLMEPS